MLWLCVLLIGGTSAQTLDLPFSATLALKVPGNEAVRHTLQWQRQPGSDVSLALSDAELPLRIERRVEPLDGNTCRVQVSIRALQPLYFNYGEQLQTPLPHGECQFLLPGFWYHQNLRSPQQAPSFHSSDSWTVREDRLSTPLTAICHEESHQTYSVLRLDPHPCDALTTHREGEVILSGPTSVGYTGFRNHSGLAALAYGFPYSEAPRSYVRKLTLAPPVEAFHHLAAGQTLQLRWEVRRLATADFSECVQQMWEYSFDTFQPQPVETPYSVERMKEVMSRFFTDSYVDTHPLHYYSGVELETATCAATDVAEVGFVGRTLLNAFNAIEYGRQHSHPQMVAQAESVFNSYLEHGFTPSGFFRAKVLFRHPDKEQIHSIRRQSEGIYAALLYLQYERQQNRRHPLWESHLRTMLENVLRLQNPDGSFPRKFRDDFSVVDASGGSTPSATLPLVMAYRYFKDKRYLLAAKQSVSYLEQEIIAKADYFSSTLDANCEDKEAALAAATATYYLALVSKGAERAHYASLTRRAAYFGLSWYYTWDVPFAPGQMLGDLGLQSRGWGNVSVENNHIDVFVFEFADVLRWLGHTFAEPRFSRFAEVISTSMRQLLPYEGHACGIAKPGFYPEVVQHTTWDYGRNGKGYYNNIFAPGWTVASLWQLLTPGRAEQFLTR